jgi:hypothetical protein
MKAARFLAVPVFVILLGAVMLLSNGLERAAYEQLRAVRD